eukprot:473311-Pyramimonas_sp.AAC.2
MHACIADCEFADCESSELTMSAHHTLLAPSSYGRRSVLYKCNAMPGLVLYKGDMLEMEAFGSDPGSD